MQTLYVTCTILSMIWTLGDFNSVYLLTGGGPGDLTHVLATLGIRYLRLDQVDLSIGRHRGGDAAGAAAGLFHDEAAVAMRIPSLTRDRHRGEAAADRHPGADLDPAADLPPVPVRDLAEGSGLRRQALAGQSDAAQFRRRVPPGALLPAPFLAAVLEFAGDRGRDRRSSRCWSRPSAAFAISRLKVKGGRAIMNLALFTYFIPAAFLAVPMYRTMGTLRPAQQPVGADPRDGDDRVALRDLGAEAGLRQAAGRARRGGDRGRRLADAAVPAGLSCR